MTTLEASLLGSLSITRSKLSPDPDCAARRIFGSLEAAWGRCASGSEG
jgi:hypothetical protein